MLELKGEREKFLALEMEYLRSARASRFKNLEHHLRNKMLAEQSILHRIQRRQLK
jgi:hypothetical protein